MKKIVFVVASILVLYSCGANSSSDNNRGISREQAFYYNDALYQVKELEKRLTSLSNASMEEISMYSDSVKNLQYNYDTVGMSRAKQQECESLKRRVSILKNDAEARIAEVIKNYSFPIMKNDDLLLEKTEAWPARLERGDVLHFDIHLQNPGTVNVYNMDSKKLLKSYPRKTAVKDSISIQNKGIYLVEVNPGSTQYSSININFKNPNPGSRKAVEEIHSEEVSCGPKDFRARSNKGIIMKPAFDEARKFTLRGQLKSMFSGSSKALVAVQVPSGATDLLYSLRISTSEQDKYSDGKFPQNMNTSYHRVRFIGLPLYESSRGIGLLNTLLDDNRPLREEDAYCNMYVFRSQSQAKQFQDGTKAASALSYDVDYSTLGTQSCNGRIPTKGSRTIYLAFENERVRYSNYIWVEVLTSIPTTEYHTTKYY